jgi:glycosyltransferase involved in cell wall biosynthesis
MKKKLLFIMNNLHAGGAEKALVSLLQTIDYSKYEVDLFLFEKAGLFLKSVPAAVNIIEPRNYKYFNMPLSKAVIANLKKGNFKTAFYRMLFGYVYKTEKLPVLREQKSWKYLAKALPKLDKTYDLSVGYLEKRPNYFCIDNTTARKKIAFIHNDYNMLKMDAQIDLPYFEKCNKVFTISAQCETILKENFPTLKDTFAIMYNIVSPDTIRQMANENVAFETKGTTLVTVGRLNAQKGFDWAVDALKILVDRGFDLYWYILGEGEQRDTLQTKITQLGLEDRFILAGIKENPYPYVRKADLYVQPSRFEGKSIAIDEAKILAKPIVVTNFPSVIDQIVHRENGYIVEMNPQSIADGIAELLQNSDLKAQLIANLQREKLGTEHEIQKIYAALD